MLKLNENPPICWSDQGIRNFQGTWWVIHCKSRNEKALAWDMLSREINYFLPMSLKVTKKRGRTTKTMMPIFPGYIFFCGNEQQRLAILKTNRIANIIEVQDQYQLVEELEPIELALNAGIELEPCRQFDLGDSCRVVAGPLAGTKGRVIQIDKQMHLIMTVKMLGQSTAVKISADMVEKLDEN